MSYNNTTTAQMEHLPSLLGAISGSALCALAFFGNSVLIGIIAATKACKEPFYIVVTSQSVNDLIFTCLGSLFVYIYGQEKFPLSVTWCKAMQLTRAVTFTSSFFHICYLSAWRYMAVVWPQRFAWAKSVRGTTVMTLIAWLLCIAIGCASSIKIQTADSVYFNLFIMNCEADTPGNIYAVIGVYSVATGFVVYCYIHIFVTVRKSRQSAQSHSTTERKHTKKEVNLLKTMTAVASLFLLTFLPSNAIQFLGKSGVAISHYAYVFTVITFFMPPAANWMVYGFGLKQFKEKLVALFKCKLCRAQALVHPAVAMARDPAGKTHSTEN